MFDRQELDRIRRARKSWESECLNPHVDRAPERREHFITTSGMEVESESIHTVIAQAASGSKSSTGGQKLPTNDGASGLKCGRIPAGSDTKEHRKYAGPGQPPVATAPLCHVLSG